MQCPSCDATMSTIDYEGIKIETCPGCGGEWLDATELRHVGKVRERRFSEAERKAVAAAKKIPGKKLADEERGLHCPRCAEPTHAVNYGGDSGVIIDRCAACGGVWLDADELEHVQTLVEHWEDGLPADLAQHGPRLHQIAEDVDRRGRVSVSRFGFVNAIINGVLDVVT